MSDYTHLRTGQKFNIASGHVASQKWLDEKTEELDQVADQADWLQIYCAVLPLVGREDPEAFPALYAHYPALADGAVRRTDQLFNAYKERWSNV